MRVSNQSIGLLLIGFAVWVFIYTQGFPNLDNGYPGPALFPRVLAGLFILAGIGLIINGVRCREKWISLDTDNITHKGIFNILFVLGVIVCYIYFSDFFGFLILSPILLFLLLKFIKVKTILSLFVSIIVPLGIYILFAKILLVPLPWGLWGW